MDPDAQPPPAASRIRVSRVAPATSMFQVRGRSLCSTCPAGPTKTGESEDPDFCCGLGCLAAVTARPPARQPRDRPQEAHLPRLCPGIQWPSTCACSQVPTRHTGLATGCCCARLPGQGRSLLSALSRHCPRAWTEGWMDGWMSRWTDEWMDDGLMDRWVDGWTNGWVDRRMGGWVDDELMDRWMDILMKG